MTPTTELQIAIETIVKQVQKQNPEIGGYKRHFNNSNADFGVQLDNGGMRITRELATDVSNGVKLVEPKLSQLLLHFRKGRLEN